MEIRSLTARPILDSRGYWSVEAAIVLGNGARAVASVPQGKSTGSHEAVALPADAAVRGIAKVIAPKIARMEFSDQKRLDTFLLRLDGTPEKRKLGANAILAVSIAYLRAQAIAQKMPLWRHIRAVYGMPVKHSREAVHPRLFVNVVNGGLHAGNNLPFQEYLLIPKARTLKRSVEIAERIYHDLGAALVRAKSKGAANLGDEGGYAPNFKDVGEPFRILRAVARKARLAAQVDFGMDAAATEAGLKTPELMKHYAPLLKQNDFIYLEDPFPEESFKDFAVLAARSGAKAWIAGDDLTTTNVRRMERAHAEGSLNAVIIKPNQIGSVSEALDAVRLARSYGWAVIASHRSGETNDDFIADFAYGVAAEGFKLGAPARGERVAKYNRLLEIEANQ